MAERLTAAELVELERLEKAATVGPWVTDDDPHSCDEILAVDDDDDTTLIASVAGDIGDDPKATANQELIVALRNAAPALLAAAADAEGLRERVVELEAVAAEGRKAGRAEAAHILMEKSAEEWSGITDPLLIASYKAGCTDEYGYSWVPEKVLAMFDATESVVTSLLDRLDGAFWSMAGRAEDAESALTAANERVERLEAVMGSLATSDDEAIRASGVCSVARAALAGKVVGWSMEDVEAITYETEDSSHECCVCKNQPGTLTNDDGSHICEDCAQAMNDMRPD